MARVTISNDEFSATASLTINVGSTLACNVKEVSSDEGKDGKEGKVDLKAEFTYVGLPAPADLIEVIFDSVTLISEPFAVFTKETKKPGYTSSRTRTCT